MYLHTYTPEIETALTADALGEIYREMGKEWFQDLKLSKWKN